MLPSAAAPKMTRLLACPVRPKGIRSIAPPPRRDTLVPSRPCPPDGSSTASWSVSRASWPGSSFARSRSRGGRARKRARTARAKRARTARCAPGGRREPPQQPDRSPAPARDARRPAALPREEHALGHARHPPTARRGGGGAGLPPPGRGRRHDPERRDLPPLLRRARGGRRRCALPGRDQPRRAWRSPRSRPAPRASC